MRHLIRVYTVSLNYRNFYAKYNRSEKFARNPNTRNELVQMIRIDKSTGQKRVNMVSKSFHGNILVLLKVNSPEKHTLL